MKVRASVGRLSLSFYSSFICSSFIIVVHLPAIERKNKIYNILLVEYILYPSWLLPSRLNRLTLRGGKGQGVRRLVGEGSRRMSGIDAWVTKIIAFL